MTVSLHIYSSLKKILSLKQIIIYIVQHIAVQCTQYGIHSTHWFIGSPWILSCLHYVVPLAVLQPCLLFTTILMFCVECNNKLQAVREFFIEVSNFQFLAFLRSTFDCFSQYSLVTAQHRPEYLLTIYPLLFLALENCLHFRPLALAESAKHQVIRAETWPLHCQHQPALQRASCNSYYTLGLLVRLIKSLGFHNKCSRN